MIDITRSQVYPIDVIDLMLKAQVTDAIGVSTGGYGTKLHLPEEASTSDQNKAQKIFDNWDNLNPSIDKTSMVVGDADPIITYDTADSEVGYVVLLDDDLYSEGMVEAIAGTATLELDSPEAGTYEIYVYRLAGNFASGSVSIIVSEV